MTDIHSCGYYCDKPLCIKAQRDELRDKLFAKEWQNLTDEEMMQSYVALKSVAGFYSLEKYARDIEAKLKEKNGAT